MRLRCSPWIQVIRPLKWVLWTLGSRRWCDDMLCLLIFSSPGNALNLPVIGGPDWRGLTHWWVIVWQPGIIGIPRLRLCCDCLRLITLFRDVLLFVCGQTDSSAQFPKDIGDWRTIVFELGSLGRDHPSCYQIKGLETVIEPRWGNDILSPAVCQCARVSRWCHCTCGSRDPGDWAVGPSGRLYGTL